LRERGEREPRGERGERETQEGEGEKVIEWRESGCGEEIFRVWSLFNETVTIKRLPLKIR